MQLSDDYYSDFRLLVINGETNQVVHSLPGFPSGSIYDHIAIDTVRNYTYVEMSSTNSDCTVSVVNGWTEEIVKTIDPGGDICGEWWSIRSLAKSISES
jgi:DNA-binding beta-propeller fold protein YncE